MTKILLICTVAIGVAMCANTLRAQNDKLTPVQRVIERERTHLSSAETEERRDALMRLANLKRPDASRAAAVALNDPAAEVRVAAAHAITSLPAADAVALLVPLLRDKSDFVRRETAYALGEIHSRIAVEGLLNSFATEKDDGVRAAVVVALGEIGDDRAVSALSSVLNPDGQTKGKKKKTRENEFVMSAAAHSLGQIHSKASVPVLIAVLENETYPMHVRREAAIALGTIGDQAALPAVRAALNSADPYLAEAAKASLRQLRQ